MFTVIAHNVYFFGLIDDVTYFPCYNLLFHNYLCEVVQFFILEIFAKMVITTMTQRMKRVYKFKLIIITYLY